MIQLKGKAFSSGFARGIAYVYSDILESNHAAYNISKDQHDAEYDRIDSAKEEVRQQLFDSAKRVGSALNKNVADIFLAQETMLVDPQLVDDLKQTLGQKHVNAEQVIGTVFRRWIRKFRDSPSTMLNERADDIEDLYRRMLRVLVGVEAHKLEKLPENTILVARSLMPSDTVFLTRKSCSGILLEIAAPTAHSTILAREFGVPCVGQVRGLILKVNTGDEILVDGNTGKVFVNPTEVVIETYHTARKKHVRQSAKAIKNRFKSAATTNGQEVTVMANASSSGDIIRAVDSGADGIGLFRTERFFLAAKALPTVPEFRKYLLRCLKPLGDKSINLRLLDIGGDKIIPYLSLPFELNPFLGRRGVRLLFDFPALLKIQIKAILSVSKKYNVRILIPMVTFAEEVKKVRVMCETISKQMKIPMIQIGAMIETPAAALAVPSLCKYADFLCIGTNDLTQYVMAADRESALVSKYFRDDHSIILGLLESIAVNAGETPVTLCGELAVKRDALSSILKTGICSLSIAPLSTPGIKEAVRRV